jgi:aspartyl-tRNA(Asn)/glutamyl-tRNA(Gln) amidotransferase subunit C
MKITEIEVAHIAKLARLSMTHEETQAAGAQLESILSYVEKLNRIDTTSVEPTSHVLQMSNVFRPDVMRPSLSTEEALAGAPDTDGGHFRVPKIVGG